jgi:hypothetical protein
MRLATATVATPATVAPFLSPSVATVASVAVAMGKVDPVLMDKFALAESETYRL